MQNYASFTFADRLIAKPHTAQSTHQSWGGCWGLGSGSPGYWVRLQSPRPAGQPWAGQVCGCVRCVQCASPRRWGGTLSSSPESGPRCQRQIWTGYCFRLKTETTVTAVVVMDMFISYHCSPFIIPLIIIIVITYYYHFAYLLDVNLNNWNVHL